jgi:S1-C subfamily serine protease
MQAVKVGFTDAAGAETTFVASIVGTDAQHDLAVLQVDAPAELLQPLAVGTSAQLKVGPS